MKKIFILAVILFCILSCGNLAASTGAQFSISGEEAFRWYNNTDKTALNSVITFTAETDSFETGASFHYDEDRLGATLQGFFPLTVTNRLRIGPDASVDYIHRLDMYHEVDLMAGIRTVWKISRNTTLNFGIWYMMKSSHIDSLQPTLPWLMSNTLAFSLEVQRKLSQTWMIGFSAASFNSTQHPVFLAPFFTLYTGYALTDDISAYLKAEAHYIDMFTLSGNLNTVQTKVCIYWRLP